MHLLARQIITRTDTPQQLLSDVPLYLLLHFRRDLHIRQLAQQQEVNDIA